MKVLYTIGAKFGGTGIGRTAARSVKDIAANHELHVAAAGFAGDLPDSVAAIKISLPKRWPFANKKRFRLKKAITFDTKATELITPQMDVFHSWNSHCLECLKTARSQGLTTIVVRASSHMLTQMEILNEEFEKFVVKREIELPEMIDRCVEECELADYVQVPSEFVRKSFIDRGVPEEKLIFAPFGVDSSRFRPAESTDDVFRVLFVGRIGLRKGVQYLLEAWKALALPKAELVLLGNIEPGFEKLMSEYRSLPGVVLPGFVKDPAETFASASVFIFPSLEEGSALVTYEALAAALPVITTFNSGSLVRDGVDGFIVPIRSAEAICDRISKLYEDRELGRHMGHSGRELVRQYTWDRYSRALAAHYRHIEEIRSGAES